MKSRKVVFPIQNSYFSGLAYNPASFSFAGSFWTYSQCSFSLLEYIKILSIYTKQNRSKYLCKVSFINLCIVAGAFVSPKGITKNSYRPRGPFSTFLPLES